MDSNSLIVGFDEAGRGPLAGPVVASAVILPPDFPVEILNDSKKLSKKKREYAEGLIKEKAYYGIGIVDHKKIDEINILQASLLAMKLAYDDLLAHFSSAIASEAQHSISTIHFSGIVDGTFCPEVPIECRCEPKADSKYPQVMAASIIAKTCRDRIMLEMDKKFPEYGYARHKGYPTPAHKKICRQLGPSPIQRLTFKY